LLWTCLPPYGAGLARFLVSAGAAVYECERPRRVERRRGKSDLIDATLAAGRLLSGAPLARLRGGGAREELRLLLLERRGAVRARTAALNQLQAVVVTAPEALRARFRGLGGSELASALGRLRLGGSGLRQRHRLNRGGDRQLNRALHVISLNRVRWHPETAAYHEKLLASGKTPREARRCLKRMLARYFHRRLQMIPALDLTP
jgi:hypothetical protein